MNVTDLNFMPMNLKIKDRTGQDTTNQLNEQRLTSSNIKIAMRKNQDQLNLTFARNKEIISNTNQKSHLFYISIAFLMNNWLKWRSTGVF